MSAPTGTRPPHDPPTLTVGRAPRVAPRDTGGSRPPRGSFARRAVPLLFLPLALIGLATANSPWLRAFPSAVLAVPLYLSVVVSLLVPVIVVGIGVRRLWASALIDVVVYVFVTLLVTLREPVGFGDLYAGLVHGPSQVLTFALPLVSPRSLLVVPVTLAWLCGAVIGECLARGWQTVLPYVALLATFALAYAGSARAITGGASSRRYDIVFAAVLLITMLLMRAVGAWLQQDADAEATQPDGVLPLRGFALGAGLAAGVTLVVVLIAQTGVFGGPPTQPARNPPLDRTRPLTPIAFTAGLRPADPRAAGQTLFSVTVDRASSNYVAIGDVDLYDGDSWSFDRTFRPSGGVIPAVGDPSLRPAGEVVTQSYAIDRGPMTTVPWMPFLYRPQRVSGATVDVDATSGMIVPSRGLRAGQRYTVQSATPSVTFGRLPATALPATSAPPVDTQLPGAVRASMVGVVTSLQRETGTSSSTPPVRFLQALLRDLRTNYSLLAGAPSPAVTNSDAPGTSGTSSPGTGASPPSGSGSGSGSSGSGPSAGSTSSSSSSGGADGGDSRARTGGTSYADVLASILGPKRAATPAQYATLVALVARQLGVPARLVTGFRLPLTGSSTTLAPGPHTVTSADAWTWVEIPVQHQGWVVLDAAPLTYSGPQPGKQTSAGVSPSRPPTSTGSPLVTSSSQNPPVAPNSSISIRHNLSGLVVLIIVLIVVVLVAGLLLLAPVSLRRLRTMRRRRASGPRRRVIGAWQESLDTLAEFGLPDLTTLTGAEVAAAVAGRFGGETGAQVRYLGDAANRAIFSPASYIAAADADEAWRAHAVLRRTVRQRSSRVQRLGADLRFHRDRRRRPVTGPSSWAAVARTRGRRPDARHRRRH